MQLAVIGAGVSGLSCGIRLLERGHAVTLFAERRTPETTSDRSAALFTPFVLEGTPREHAWVAAASQAFEALAVAAPESGVSMCVLREYRSTPLTATPWWAASVQGFQRLRELPKGVVDGFAAVVPRIDMTRYMPWLERRFEHELGGAFAHARVLDLDEVFDEGFEMVVNCSGLGARRLAHDDAVFPMRGQVLHVPNNLRLDACLCEEGDGKLSTYVFPFEDHVVLGGTMEPDEWIEECDEPTLVALVDRARGLLRTAGIAASERLGRRRLRALVGLRPCRREGERVDAVRLEVEELAPGRLVVHDYGHGRAGVTLSWGCAEEVAGLCASSAPGGAERDDLRARSA